MLQAVDALVTANKIPVFKQHSKFEDDKKLMQRPFNVELGHLEKVMIKTTFDLTCVNC